MATNNIHGYFTDRRFNVLGVASTSLPDCIHIYQDTEIEEIEAGGSTFEATLSYKKKNSDELHNTSFVKVGNFFLFQDEHGNSKWYTILKTKKDRKKRTIWFYAEDAGLDLLNEVLVPYTADKAYPIAHYIEKFSYDSGFTIGINELGTSLTRKLSWDGTATGTERLLSVCTQFDNAELSYSFELTNNRISGKYINIHKKRGAETNIKLSLDRDVDNIITNESIMNLRTGLRPTGGTPEGADNPITLQGYKYDDGMFYVKGDKLLNREANKLWTRYLSESGTDEGYIIGEFEFDTLSQAELCNRAITQLKAASEIEQNFEVDIAKLPESVRIGDTVYIIDSDDNLYLQARILKLEKSRTRNKAVATLGDYIIKRSNISSQLQDLANKIKEQAKAAQTALFLIRSTGSTVFKNGEGTVTLTAVIEKANADITDQFTIFNWVKQNKDGTVDGDWTSAHTNTGKSVTITPDDFADSATFYYEVDANGKIYTGGSSVVVKVYDGEDGRTPVKGVDYFDGVDGTDGRSAYLHVRYSQNADGNPMTTDPTNAKYLGLQASQNPNASTVPADYDWSLVKGPQGIPGEAVDGKTSYLHIKYSDDGGKTFTGNTGEDTGSYLGQYVDFEPADSTDVTKYAWSKIKGEDGADGKDGVAGKDGVGLKATAIQYAQSTSGTTAPTTGWANSVPTLVKGQYLWTKTVWTYTDNSSETGYTVSYNAKDGNTGKDGIAGKDGVGISNTVIEYVGAVSGTSKPTSGWSTTIPTVPAGQYLWTRTTWHYTDGTSEQGYSAALMGKTGSAGKDGSDGKDGVGIASTAVTYQASGSGTTAPSGTWSTTVPEVSADQYLWTRTIINYTDSTSSTSYSVGKMGADGVGSHLHTAWKMANGTFMQDYPQFGLLRSSEIKLYNSSTANVLDKSGFETSGKLYFSRTAVTHGGFYINDLTDFYPNTTYIEEFTLKPTSGAATEFLIFNQFTDMTYFEVFINGESVTTSIASSGAVPYEFELNKEYAFKVVFTTGSMETIPSYYGLLLQVNKTVAVAYSFEMYNVALYTQIKENTYPKYRGEYSDNSEVSSTNPDDYTWTVYLGQEGSEGTSVTSVVEEYYISTSPDSQAGGSWSTTVPNNADPNKYIWRRMKTTLSDGTVTYTNPALIQGMTGIYPYIGPTAPANPKDGQQWWKSDSSGNVTDFLVYKSGSWQGQTIQQSILNIVTLNAVTITGSTITGTNINGSVFTNTFTVDLGVSDTGTGTTVIKDGYVKMDMTVKDSAGTDSYLQGHELSPVNGLYMWQRLNGVTEANADFARLTPAGLQLSLPTAGFGGTLTAEALTPATWVNITYGSGYTTSESNPCQYRIVYNVDGSRTVEFRGQVKKTTGSFTNGGTDYISTLPASIRPSTNQMMNAVGDATALQSIRMTVITDGRFQIKTWGASSYVNISGMRYSI